MAFSFSSRFMARGRKALAWLTASALVLPVAVAAEDIPLSVAIGNKRSVTGLPDYIATGYRFAVGIVAVVAMIMVVYGGFRYLIGSASEDVKRGKEIIKDAIIGMLIVLGAWVILNTVNPATLTLRMPAIPKIKKVEYGLSIAAPSNTFGGRRQCAFDSQCVAVTEPGHEVPAGKCLLIRNPLADGMGRFNGQSTSGGICSTGDLGSLCACGGGGCGLNSQTRMNQATDFNRTNSTNASSTNNNFEMTVACNSGLDCIPQLRSEQRFASEFVLPYCMRSGAITGEEFFRLHSQYTGDKVPACTQDSECRNPSLPANLPGNVEWRCIPIGNRSQARNTSAGAYISPGERGVCMRECRSDAECGSGKCIARYFAPDANIDITGSSANGGRISGVCTYAGKFGEQCFCTGLGCSAPRPEFNNAISHSCASGLSCLPVKNNEPVTPHGLGETSVTDRIQSLNWDALCMPTGLQPPPSVVGKCDFTCVRPAVVGGAPAGPDVHIGVDRNVPCSGDIPVSADRNCWEKSHTTANADTFKCSTLAGPGYVNQCEANASAPGCSNGLNSRCIPNPAPGAAPVPPAGP